MMKKVGLASIIMICFSIGLKAQMYKTTIGLRMGPELGVSFKQFLNSNTAAEGIISTRWNGASITGLYEIHNLAGDIDGLFWYYGGGAHLSAGTNYNNLGAGIDGIIGIEYTLREYPVNIALDWKPALDIVGDFRPWITGAALTVRYVFKY